MGKAALYTFDQIVDQISEIGRDRHKDDLIRNAQQNLDHADKSIKALTKAKGKKAESCIVISAGPSVHKKQSIKKIKESNYPGLVIAADGAYIACLKQDFVPDYVITLDPHPTRMVRWFGDPDFEEHAKKDDYFARQDLDVKFRENTLKQNQCHIELVNKYGPQTKILVASCAPANVVARLKESSMDAYWWNPLVDDPSQEDSLTRAMHKINKLPCINTGGNVGTAGWVFAQSVFSIPNIALCGMDFGYYEETPKEKTQLYYELLNHLGDKEKVLECFMDFKFPLNGDKFYTDPTYYWYRKNFLDLLDRSTCRSVNCTEGGTLFDDKMKCLYLDDYINQYHGCPVIS